jgi:hypothetical protein
MAKSQDAKKTVKKEPLKTAKEKAAEKKKRKIIQKETKISGQWSDYSVQFRL